LAYAHPRFIVQIGCSAEQRSPATSSVNACAVLYTSFTHTGLPALKSMSPICTSPAFLRPLVVRTLVFGRMHAKNSPPLLVIHRPADLLSAASATPGNMVLYCVVSIRFLTFLPKSTAKSAVCEEIISFCSGKLPMNQAGKYRLSSSDLPKRGAIAVASLSNSPRAAFSSFPASILWCAPIL